MNMREKCKQTAVYWAAPVSDGRGKWTFASPAEVKVRWENTAQEYTSPEGEVKVSTAVVFLLTQDVVVGGFLYLGTLASITGSTSDPTVIFGAYKVQQFAKMPTISAREFVRRAIL